MAECDAAGRQCRFLDCAIQCEDPTGEPSNNKNLQQQRRLRHGECPGAGEEVAAAVAPNPVYLCDYPRIVMRVHLDSDFCLQPWGDSPTRRSFFDAMLAGCIPVVFSDWSVQRQFPWHLPVHEVERIGFDVGASGDAVSVSSSRSRSSHSPRNVPFYVFIPAEAILNGSANLAALLSSFPPYKVTRMRHRIMQLLPRLLYRRTGEEDGVPAPQVKRRRCRSLPSRHRPSLLPSRRRCSLPSRRRLSFPLRRRLFLLPAVASPSLPAVASPSSPPSALPPPRRRLSFPPRRRLSLISAVASPSSPPSPLPPPRRRLSFPPRRRLSLISAVASHSSPPSPLLLPAVASPSPPPSPLPPPCRRLWRHVHERKRELVREGGSVRELGWVRERCLVRERGLVRQRGLFSEAF
ncbi:unnamed protein product [Closterium sp. Naga37s-1]|nr:unnamed protein product [Closterium sp. Naga37s-1]